MTNSSFARVGFIKSKLFKSASAVLLIAALHLACTKKAEDPPGTLHLSTIAKIKGLDPAFTSDLYSGTQASYAYEGLLQYHYLKRPYVLIANLAEGLPALSADRKTYTFKIKQGVLFQDDPCFKETGGKGRELTAEDFVFSFKRLADPKVLSPGWWIFDGKIKGLNEWREQAGKSDSTDYGVPIEGLRAVDRYTLEIRLTSPSAQFLYYLAMPFASVVAREAVEAYGKDFSRHAVGTGPFRLVDSETNLNAKIVWVKNPTYRVETYPSEGELSDRTDGLLEDAGKRLPMAERVVVEVFVESQPLWLNFLAGKLDASGIPKDNFEQAITPGKSLTADLSRRGIRLVKNEALDLTHESFNMKDPILGKNKLLRQALSLAYDSGPAINLFYNGRAVAAQWPIPPGLAGFDPQFQNPYRQFSLARAKDYLRRAGYPNGEGLPEFEYSTMADSSSRQMAEYLAKSFEPLGIKVKINGYTWPEFQKVVLNRKGQMWGYAWSADYPDAENFLQLFYSKNVAPGPNDSHYINQEYDRLYEKSLTLKDSPERTALYKKMAEMVVEDCPWIFGVHRITFALIHPWLKNYKIHEFDHATVKYLRVDPTQKK